MQDCKISVIIPTLNRADFIPETIHSIANQTVKPYEIIVVDNGSDDNTVELLEKLFPEQVKIIENDGNFYPGAARNLGIEAATGDYIQFFDSDDIMTKNRFESLLAVFAKYPDTDAVYSPYVMAREDNVGSWKQTQPVLQFRDSHLGKHTHKDILKGFNIPIWCFLFKSSVVKHLGKWREDIFAYEDYDYLFRLIMSDITIKHDNKSCVIYRVHGNQITGNAFSDKRRDIEKLRCLAQLLSRYENQLSSRCVSIAKTMIHRLEHDTNCTNISGLNYWFTNLSLRIGNKINRMVTRTDWQRIHQPEDDKKVFRDYLSLL